MNDDHYPSVPSSGNSFIDGVEASRRRKAVRSSDLPPALTGPGTVPLIDLSDPDLNKLRREINGDTSTPTIEYGKDVGKSDSDSDIELKFTIKKFCMGNSGEEFEYTSLMNTILNADSNRFPKVTETSNWDKLGNYQIVVRWVEAIQKVTPEVKQPIKLEEPLKNVIDKIKQKKNKEKEALDISKKVEVVYDPKPIAPLEGIAILETGKTDDE